MNVRVWPLRRLSTEELMLLKCSAGKDSCEWVLWSARKLNWSILKEINHEYSLEELMLKLKLQYFGPLIELTHWKRPWWWERLRAGGEGDNRGWDGWMASLTQWTWIWANSGRQWRTRKPGVLQSMGSQRVGQVLASEQYMLPLYRLWLESLS